MPTLLEIDNAIRYLISDVRDQLILGAPNRKADLQRTAGASEDAVDKLQCSYEYTKVEDEEGEEQDVETSGTKYDVEYDHKFRVFKTLLHEAEEAIAAYFARCGNCDEHCYVAMYLICKEYEEYFSTVELIHFPTPFRHTMLRATDCNGEVVYIDPWYGEKGVVFREDEFHKNILNISRFLIGNEPEQAERELMWEAMRKPGFARKSTSFFEVNSFRKLYNAKTHAVDRRGQKSRQIFAGELSFDLFLSYCEFFRERHLSRLALSSAEEEREDKEILARYIFPFIASRLSREKGRYITFEELSYDEIIDAGGRFIRQQVIDFCTKHGIDYQKLTVDHRLSLRDGSVYAMVRSNQTRPLLNRIFCRNPMQMLLQARRNLMAEIRTKVRQFRGVRR